MNPTYTRAQIGTYFRRIELPTQWAKSAVFADPSLARTKMHGLPLLQVLVRHHISRIPFEDLGLHYSTHKVPSLDLADLHRQMAVDGARTGRGGQCMEHNTFFGAVLRSLGYEVRNGGSRVSKPGSPDARSSYSGWSHMHNLVRLDRQWYLVDVGMSARGPAAPIPLKDGYEAVSVAPRQVRVQRRSISERGGMDADGEQEYWCYDMCSQPDEEDPRNSEWQSVYCFAETEYLPQDFEMMSWFASTSPSSYFVRYVMCSRMILDEQKDAVIGDITLAGDTVRRTVNGQREVLRVCESEADRIEALEEFFGIVLTKEQAEAISDEASLD